MPKISQIFRIVLYLSILISFNIKLYSQDVHFSQRFASNAFLNDNYVLEDNEKLALYSIYREQWGVLGKPYTTAAVGGVLPIVNVGPVLTKVGVQVINDESGDASLKSSQLYLNLMGEYRLDNHLFGLNIGNGYVFRSFDAASLSFPTQFDRNTGRFNSELPNPEGFDNRQVSFFKINVAQYWRYKWSSFMTTHFGLSFRQLNQPDVSILNSTDELNPAIGVQIGVDYFLKENMTLKPSLSYYNLQNASETILGSAIELKLRKESMLKAIEPFLLSRLGFSRSFDALIIGSHIQWSTFNIGLSYDVNVSSLKVATNNQGAFEISLRYSIDKRGITHKRLPCERY